MRCRIWRTLVARDFARFGRSVCNWSRLWMVSGSRMTAWIRTLEKMKLQPIWYWYLNVLQRCTLLRPANRAQGESVFYLINLEISRESPHWTGFANADLTAAWGTGKHIKIDAWETRDVIARRSKSHTQCKCCLVVSIRDRLSWLHSRWLHSRKNEVACSREKEPMSLAGVLRKHAKDFYPPLSWI